MILAVSVTPDACFLRDTNLQFGPRGHIKANDKLETNIKDVYAIGDAVILQNNNLNYNVIYVHPQSHASYYPSASPIAIKLIYDNESVDKRIDDIAAVIKLGGKIHDLTELKLCYAPPYSSAKDPVNIAEYFKILLYFIIFLSSMLFLITMV